MSQKMIKILKFTQNIHEKSDALKKRLSKMIKLASYDKLNISIYNKKTYFNFPTKFEKKKKVFLLIIMNKEDDADDDIKK